MDLITHLLDAAEARSVDVSSTIADIGFDAVADVLFQEVLFRARLDEVACRGLAVTVLVLEHRGRTAELTIPAGETASDVPPVVITQDAGETVRALYGPRELVSSSTRTVSWPGSQVVRREWEGTPLPDRWAAPPQRVLDVLDRRDRPGLDRLAAYCGTDKWGPLHQYAVRYEQYLHRLRDQRLTILEIGVGGYDDPKAGGESLRMWKHYFPRALVCGVDVVDKRAVEEPRVLTVQADQSDRRALEAVVERIGPPDVVVDDGSHVSTDVIASFDILFPLLRHGGLYFVEDLQTSLWPFMFNGSEDDLTRPDHTFGFLKRLVDGLHHEEFLTGARPPSPTDRTVAAVHLFHNLAVVEKGTNADGSPVADALRSGMFETG
ncbi:hypothetical protein [Umezawaea sp. NPDC059074]|uniref:hypothetical protein n=1 Tax=Umezawaea sp. NPDC059074 TaxID=3346716 RepID=UPI003691981D